MRLNAIIRIKKILDPQSKATDFNRPGHVFPLIAKNGGVLNRPGHTEAAIDFAKLVGANPVGIICEIMNDDGSMARLNHLIEMAERFQCKLVSIEQLQRYLLKQLV